MPKVGIGIRIEGTEEQIEEAIRRLNHVFEIHRAHRFYESRSDPEIKFAYVRCYVYRDTDTLLDQLAAANDYINELQIACGERSQEIDRLKEELGLMPKPKPYDAVLSPKTGYVGRTNSGQMSL